MGLADRLLTIVATATLTSAAWVVLGSTYFGVSDGAAPLPAVPEVAVDTPSAEAPALSPSASGPLLIPVANVSADQLVDSFADERAGGARAHRAIDIMAPAGTPVVAAAPGTVESLFQSDAGGLTIYVRSVDRRTIYYYAHLQGYAAGIEEGQRIARGDHIGFVGSTGNADEDGPHLHFAVMGAAPEANWWDAATAINPYPLLGGK